MKQIEFLVISIVAGVVTGVDDNGNVVRYRQDGIDEIDADKRTELVASGLLSNDWNLYEKIPKQYKLKYEDEAILGVASRRYPLS